MHFNVDRKNERKVKEYLWKKVEEKGRDFTFRSKQITKEAGVSQYLIGRVAMHEHLADGCIKLLRKRGCNGYTWRTNFSSQ